MEAACLHPIVAWGNGTGVTDSNFTYDFLNSAAASWGMVVAASSEDNTGSGAFHKAGIDYLLKTQAPDGSWNKEAHLTQLNTCFAILSLSVHNCYLPIYQR